MSRAAPNPGRPGDVDDGERAKAFDAFRQAAACRSSAVLCMTAALDHIAMSTLAAGADVDELHTALDAWHREFTLALDGALIEVIARHQPAGGDR